MRVSNFKKNAGISLDEVQKALGKCNKKDYHLNSKMSQEEIDFLNKYFKKDILIQKQKIDEEEQKFFDDALEGINFNLNFTFYDKEKKDLPLIFTEHKRLIEINDCIQSKRAPFHNLSRYEKCIWLKSTFKSLEVIQQEMKKNRKRIQNLIKEKTSTSYLTVDDPTLNLSYPNGENPFYSSLGDDEEAHIASWNID